jgi:NAD(P)-dependent dehydrogenase (short-subunit alcohol dehydrogenase family)
MDRNVLIIGVDVEGNNIGSAIEFEIKRTTKATGVVLEKYGDLPSPAEITAAGYTDLVVSCGLTVMSPFEDQMDGALIEVVEACLITPMIAARRFAMAQVLQERDYRSKIILIGSYAHNHVLSNSAAYCASKAGLHMLGRCLGWELTSKMIDTIVVHPHSVLNTPMTKTVLDTIEFQKGLLPSEAVAYWERDLLLDKRLTKNEIAELVSNLVLGRATAHLSGTAIELYGGSR